MAQDKAALIRQLNDQFRIADESTDVPGTFLVTASLSAHIQETGHSPIDLIELVMAYDDFNLDVDPHREHDFGAFDFEGERCFWKIDYFSSEAMYAGSENPADPACSYRVLTAMLASEY